MRGKWHSNYFKNSLPIVVEIGCGKGEYTIGLAERYPNKNFIGIDIKGARLWKGSKHAYQNGLSRVAFVRARIDFIEKIFAEGEVSEIWITFPDPQHSKPRKRLTSPLFLKRYGKILKRDCGGIVSGNGYDSSGSNGCIGNGSGSGLIHLKTDDTILYLYTLDDVVLGGEGCVNSESCVAGKLPLYAYSDDVYANTDPELDDVRAIKTFYEDMWLKMGKKIKYLCFSPFNTSKE